LCFRLGPGFDIAVRLAAGLADDFLCARNSDVNGCGRAGKSDDGSNGQDAHGKKGAKGLKANVTLLGLVVQHEVPPSITTIASSGESRRIVNSPSGRAEPLLLLYIIFLYPQKAERIFNGFFRCMNVPRSFSD
jgi:hypothetical protein